MRHLEVNSLDTDTFAPGVVLTLHKVSLVNHPFFSDYVSL